MLSVTTQNKFISHLKTANLMMKSAESDSWEMPSETCYLGCDEFWFPAFAQGKKSASIF